MSDSFSLRMERAHCRLALLERLTHLEFTVVAEGGVPDHPGFPMEYHCGVHQLVRDIMFDIRPYVDWSPDTEPSEKWIQEVLKEARKSEREALGWDDEPRTPVTVDREGGAS